MSEDNNRRRTEGSISWSSCCPSLLRSTLSLPMADPDYLTNLGAAEFTKLYGSNPKLEGRHNVGKQ